MIIICAAGNSVCVLRKKSMQKNTTNNACVASRMNKQCCRKWLIGRRAPMLILNSIITMKQKSLNKETGEDACRFSLTGFMGKHSKLNRKRCTPDQRMRNLTQAWCGQEQES